MLLFFIFLLIVTIGGFVGYITLFKIEYDKQQKVYKKIMVNAGYEVKEENVLQTS
jgi:hypothetical protein